MLERVYEKIREWLASSRWGVVCALLIGPLFLLPDDIRDRKGLYGHMARSFMHVVWPAFFFATAYLNLLNYFSPMLNSDLVEENFFGVVPESFVLSSANFIAVFLISCTAILLFAAIEWGFHSICGALVRVRGERANTPRFTYFTIKYGVVFCWFGVGVWVAAIAFPYVTNADAFSGLAHGITSHPLILVLIAISSLLIIRSDYIRQLAFEQMYPNRRIRLLVLLAPIPLLLLVMVAVPRVASMV